MNPYGEFLEGINWEFLISMKKFKQINKKYKANVQSNTIKSSKGL